MLPPYGKILKAYQDANIILPYPVMCYVGKDAFRATRAQMPYQACLCLPFNEDVARYDWPVKGLRMVIADTGGMDSQTLDEIAYYLLCEQAEMVCLQSPLFPLAKLFTNKDIV